MSDILLSVDGDTRPLESKLNRISSKSINFNLKDGISQPLGRITGKVSEFDKSLEASNARVLAFGASAGAVYALGRAFKEMVSSTIEVEKSLADINVVLNASSSQLNQFSSGLFNVAKNTGQSFSEVAKAATELARQGLGIEETLKRTSDALILTRLSGLGAAQSVETLTAAVNGFSKAGLTTSEVLNKLSTVDQAFAVSSADLANALSRVGSTAQDVGVGIDELIAIVTAAQQTTARGGAVIGNSLKTIFTRLQRTDTLQELENLGIAVKDVAGNTLPAVQILKNLSNVFYQLGDAQRASVAETVGGVFQINILRAALGDLSKEFSIYDSALRTSATATDQAIQKNEALNQTLSALINKTLANLTQSGSKVGEITIAPTLKGGLNVLNKALEGFNQPTEAQGVGTKIATGILEGIGSYLSGPGVAVISAVFLKIFGRLTSFSAEALKGLLGISNQTDLIGQAQAKVNAILAQNPSLVEAIITKQASLLQIENQILKIIQAQNAARSAAATISASVVPKVVKGVGPSKTKSFGFVPNFSPEMQEIMGAQEGGYQAGNIKRMNISGEGKVIYNDAESVVKFPGAKQPAIIPPENSKAGRDYRKQFEKEAGFDPYASKGFIPNFAKIPQGMSLEEAVNKNYSRSMLSQRYGAAAVNEKLGPSRIRSVPTNEEINLGFTKSVSMIYPAKTGKGIANGRYKDKLSDNVYRISFTKSGFNAKTAIKPEDAQLENALGKELIKFVNNYTSQLSNGKFQKINSIKELANSGAFGSIVGTIFETAVTYATQSFKPRSGGQSALIDFPAPNKNLQELFNNAPGQYEAKGNESQDLINDVARKIYQGGFVASKIQKRQLSKVKSKGFIPNFSALQDAIEREKDAGVNPSKIRVGSDNSLVSKNNPFGLGVYNTKDEPGGLKQGIDRAKSKGYIPNYAKESQQQVNEDGFDKFQSKLLAASIALQLAAGVTNQFADKTTESSKAFNNLITGISNAAAAFAVGDIFGKKAGRFVAPALAVGMGAMQYSGMQQEKENAPYINQIQKLEEKLNSLKESGSQLESVLSKTGIVLNNYSTELENAVPDQAKIQDFRKQFLESISDLPTELKSSLLEIFKNQPILDKQTPSLLMAPLNQAQAQNQREQGMSTLQQNLTRERQKQNEVINNQSGFMRSLRNSFPIFGKNEEIEPYNPFGDKTFSERTSRTILGDALSKGKNELDQTKILTSLGEKLIEVGSDGMKFIDVLNNFSSGTEESKQAFEELTGVLASGGPQAMRDFASSMLKEIQALADNAKVKMSSSIPGQPTKIPADYKDISKTMDINEILGSQTEDMPLKLWATSSMRQRAQGVDSRTAGMYATQELQQIASLNSASFEEVQAMAPEVTNLAMQEVMKGQEDRAKALENAYGKNMVSDRIRTRNTPEAAQAYLAEALDVKDITGKMFDKMPTVEVNVEPVKEAISGLEQVLKQLETIKTIEVKLNDSDREILQGKGAQGVSTINDKELGIGDKISKEIQNIDWKQAFSTLGPAILLTVGQIAAAIITRGKSLRTSTTVGTFAKIPNFAKSNIDKAKNLEENVTGKNAKFYEKPFPHVRNSSQPSFIGAIAQHGGLRKALEDSDKLQNSVQNFAIEPGTEQYYSLERLAQQNTPEGKAARAKLDSINRKYKGNISKKVPLLKSASTFETMAADQKPISTFETMSANKPSVPKTTTIFPTEGSYSGSPGSSSPISLSKELPFFKKITEGFKNFGVGSLAGLAKGSIYSEILDPSEAGPSKGSLGYEIETGLRDNKGNLTALGKEMGLPEIAPEFQNLSKETKNLENTTGETKASLDDLNSSVKNLDSTIKTSQQKGSLPRFASVKETPRSGFNTVQSISSLPDYSNEDYENIFSSAAQGKTSRPRSAFDEAAMGSYETTPEFSRPKPSKFEKYEAYAKELKDPKTWEDYTEELGDGRIVRKNRMVEIANSIADTQAAEGYRTKDERINERRRTGIEDSGFNKAYLEWEQVLDPSRPNGIGWRQVPEQKVLARDYNPKTGMITNINPKGEKIGLESEVRQKEKQIFTDTASKKYAEQAKKRRLKSAEIGNIPLMNGGTKPIYKEGTSMDLTKEDLAFGNKLAKEMSTSYLNQTKPDENGRTGFENLQAWNRVNAPEIPAPFMNWSQEIEGKNAGKIIAAPGSVTPPSFMNENAALPLAPETLLGDKMFRSEQKFFDPSKPLMSLVPGENELDSPVAGVGNLGANARNYGKIGNPPFGGSTVGPYGSAGWDPRGSFDITDRYLGVASQNIPQGNLSYKNFADYSYGQNMEQPKTALESKFSEANSSSLNKTSLSETYMSASEKLIQANQAGSQRAQEIAQQTIPELSNPALSTTVQKQVNDLRAGTKNIAKPNSIGMKGYVPEKARIAQPTGQINRLTGAPEYSPGAVPTATNAILKQTGNNPQKINEAIKYLDKEMIKYSPDTPGGNSLQSQETRERIKMVQDQLMIKQGNIREQQSKIESYKKGEAPLPALQPLGGQMMGGIPKFGGGEYGPGGFGADKIMTNMPAKSQEELMQRVGRFGQVAGSPSERGVLNSFNQAIQSPLQNMGLGGLSQNVQSPLGNTAMGALEKFDMGSAEKFQQARNYALSPQENNQKQGPSDFQMQPMQDVVSQALESLKEFSTGVNDTSKQIKESAEQQKPAMQEQPKEKTEDKKEGDTKSFDNIIKQADTLGSAFEGLSEKIKSLSENIKTDAQGKEQKSSENNQPKELKISDVNANVNVQTSPNTETEAKIAAINAIIKELQNQLNTLKGQISGNVNPPQRI